ncbi:MAG: non-homologous end-joining DNA ligase [Acidimicrobiia bacterium]|nr:non-homologous end-joining DNA ligase [Acidimicrobiia bacterium]
MIDISNPDKEYFPGVSKRRVVEHYDAVAEVMLPHVVNRPLTLERYPNGVLAKGFMQKNASKHFPDFIDRIEIETPNTTTVHPSIADVDGLLYLAGQGTITFHIPDARNDDLGLPDRLVIDLDPTGDDPAQVVPVALATRDVLGRFGLEATPMVTGSKGIHVIVTLERTTRFQVTGIVSRALAGLVAAAVPELATLEFLKRERGGRVFVDWLRNRPGATTVAPWSLRPRSEATVAVPISWSEVGTVDPAGITIHEVARRLDADIAWAPAVELSDRADAIEAAAREAGVDLDTPFDRFGRR